MSKRTEHIGARIRIYRKAIGFTMEDLALAIHKSKSTISKYECGDVSIDAETLFDIADALQISVAQLVDYREKTTHVPQSIAPRGFFSTPGLYYMYHLGSGSSHIVCSVLEILAQADSANTHMVNFYNDIADYKNLHNCFFLYRGKISYSDLYVNFIFENLSNPVEKAFIIAVSPLSGGNRTTGIVSGISNHYLVPIAYKVLFSKQIIKNKSSILEALKFSKDEFAQLKKNSTVMLTNTRPVRTLFIDDNGQ